MNFAEYWKEMEKGDRPKQVRSFVHQWWPIFADRVREGRKSFVETMIESLYAGDVWILKEAFSPEFVSRLKAETIGWTRGREESFHKMLDGCPDFHRKIDLETGKKYSIKGCKHSAYFFRWNGDPLGIWPEITEKWRVLKIAMGLQETEYEGNKPSEGPTDRIQVVRYPPKIGYLEPHIDSCQHQRCFISGYLSKRGLDYEGGGFYFIKDKKVLDAEDEMDVGDLCIGYASVPHGVAPCDRDKTPDWNLSDGRWFLGLYSNASDYESKRSTAAPVKFKAEGIFP